MVTNKIEANILIRFAHTTMTIRQELRISKMGDKHDLNTYYNTYL